MDRYIYRVHGSCLKNSILNHSLKIEKQNHEIDQIALLNDVDCEHPSVSYTHTHTHTHTHLYKHLRAHTHTHTHKSVRTFNHGQEPWTRDFRNFTCNHGHTHFRVFTWTWTFCVLCTCMCMKFNYLTMDYPLPLPKSTIGLSFYMHAYAICYRMAGLWESWTSTVGVCPRFYVIFLMSVYGWRCLQRTHTHTPATYQHTKCPILFKYSKLMRQDTSASVFMCFYFALKISQIIYNHLHNISISHASKVRHPKHATDDSDPKWLKLSYCLLS